MEIVLVAGLSTEEEGRGAIRREKKGATCAGLSTTAFEGSRSVSVILGSVAEVGSEETSFGCVVDVVATGDTWGCKG